MSPCHNLEPSLVARDSSRHLSVKPNEWMHLSPFYTRMHGEWLRYAKSTSQFHWRFLLVRDVRGFQVNPLCRHDITFPPSGNGGYVRNLDVMFGDIEITSATCLYHFYMHFLNYSIRITQTFLGTICPDVYKTASLISCCRSVFLQVKP